MAHGDAVLEDHLQVILHALVDAVVGALRVVYAANHRPVFIEDRRAAGALGKISGDGEHAARTRAGPLVQPAAGDDALAECVKTFIRVTEHTHLFPGAGLGGNGKRCVVLAGHAQNGQVGAFIGGKHFEDRRNAAIAGHDDQCVVVLVLHHMVAGAKYTVLCQHESTRRTTVPVGAALAFVIPGNHHYTLAIALYDFGRAELLVAGFAEL